MSDVFSEPIYKDPAKIGNSTTLPKLLVITNKKFMYTHTHTRTHPVVDEGFLRQVQENIWKQYI